MGSAGPSHTLIAMSAHKQSAMEQWFKRNCSWAVPRKRPASSTSQHPDAPDADTSVPRSLPASPAQGTSRVDIVQSNVTMSQPPTVPVPTAIGEHIGHASCIDRHQAILQCEEA